MRILLAGGGTAGHINPAVAIAKYAVEKDNCEILFVGKRGGMESRLVPKEGFDIEYIDIEGLKRKITLSNIKTAYKLLTSVSKCKKIIKKFKPDVVVGTGGYVCAPAVMAANKLKIPTLIHEQNAFPGSAIKMLSKKSTVTAISYDESKKFLSGAKNIVYTGNPVRPGIVDADYNTSRKELGIKDEKFIVAFGGSLGAKKLNDVIIEYIQEINGKNDIRICFGTGMGNYDGVMEEIRHRNISLASNIEVKKYIDNMDVVMSAADVVICRAGAITLSELCTMGKPSILIPSPNVTNNHQEHNAMALEKKGAAIRISECDFNLDKLKSEISAILSDGDAYDTMSKNARKLSCEKSTEIIHEQLLRITGNNA